MKNKPKFFCETCGREVPIDVDECPYCGMHFYGVMCPRCGKSGPAGLFQNGCPRCGYRTEEGKGSSSNFPVLGAAEIHSDRERNEPVRKKSSLWGPLLTILLLATFGAALILVLLR